MSLDREPIDIVDPVTDPYKVTEAVREAIQNGKRITGIATTATESGIEVRVESEPVSAPYSQGQVPGQDRPYKIYESLTPTDAAEGFVKRK